MNIFFLLLLAIGIWAFRLIFRLWGWNLFFMAGIWSLRVGFGPWGWDLGIGAGNWGQWWGVTKKEKITHFLESIGH